MEDGTVIEARGLVKVYGDLRAVDGVDLRIPKGIVFSLLGPNGAGKTTTAEILEGLRPTTAGSAQVLGRDVASSYKAIRLRVGILPQDFEPFDRLTPREHLRYFAALFSRALGREEIGQGRRSLRPPLDDVDAGRDERGGDGGEAAGGLCRLRRRGAPGQLGSGVAAIVDLSLRLPRGPSRPPRPTESTRRAYSSVVGDIA